MTAYTDFHYSPTGSGVISGAQVLEQTEQGINGLGQYVQDNVSGAIDTANEALTTAQNADSNATAAINLANSLNAQIIAANQTAGNALTTAQSAQNTANSASSLATTANNNAATALNTANAASAGVTALTGTVNSLGNRMTAAENAINANAGNITTLQNNLATTNANVTAAANAASAAQATATSAQSTATLARNQAYVLRYTGTTITGGGTIAYADIDNTDNIKAGDKIIDISGAIYAIASVDTANQTVTVGASPVINLFCDAENLIPAANDAYDLGSSSYQWKSVYAQSYYYNGVAWGLDKANEWTGVNTFVGGINLVKYKNNLIDLTAATGSINYVTQQAIDKNGAKFGECYWAYTPSDDSSIVSIWSTTKDNVRGGILINHYGSDSRTDIVPASYNYSANLGTSTNKFKTLNGVNPGALSLPNQDVGSINLSGNITVLDGSTSNDLTQTVNGWLFIYIENTPGAYIRCYVGSGSGTRAIIRGVVDAEQSQIYVFFPIYANITVSIYVNATSISRARFYPCLGNV